MLASHRPTGSGSTGRDAGGARSLHRSKHAERGFNQPALCVYAIRALRSSHPSAADAGVEHAHAPAPPQASRPYSYQRRSNVRAAFLVSDPTQSPQTHLLIDDIFTTGATARPRRGRSSGGAASCLCNAGQARLINEFSRVPFLDDSKLAPTTR